MTEPPVTEPTATTWPFLQRLRLGLLLAALAVGALGIARDDRRVVWVAIVCAGAGSVLRFIRKR